MVKQAEHEQLLARDEAEWARDWGLRRSDRPVCMARLVGKQCRDLRGDAHELCKLTHSLYSELFDHGQLWSRSGKHALVVGRPYPDRIDARALRALADIQDDWALDVDIETLRTFYPRPVLRIEVWAPGEFAKAHAAAHALRSGEWMSTT